MTTQPIPRIALFDVLRGVALLAMAVYHFAFDLEMFGLTNLGGVSEHPLWVVFARAIAGNFLALVGVSLYLAHGQGIRWGGFLRRLAMIVAAAAAITVLSYFFDPEAMIWFGILHCIALSSVIGLAFLRLPLPVVLIAAALCFVAPYVLTAPVFKSPTLLWLVLTDEPLPSNDYNPLLPWFGAVLIGIAIARIVLPFARAGGNWAKWQPDALVTRTLALAGRHSLLVYLVHQPILIGLVYAASRLLAEG